MSDLRVVICGFGYSGAAVARAAAKLGMKVTATSRDPAGIHAPDGVEIVGFAEAGSALQAATHVLGTAPPGEDGDPVLRDYGAVLQQSLNLRWAGYLSTTGVYGDQGGGWVDETTPAAGTSRRAKRRLAAERDWTALSGHVAVDLFRVAGIYGPGRSILDDLRAGTARRVLKPGHAFGRIHRDDIAGAIMSAIGQHRAPGVRVLHLADDQPEESAVVTAAAANMLGLPVPPGIPYADAISGMGEMARSFWADNRKVASALTQSALGYRWRYPGYREGLESILAEERGDGADQQREITRP